MMEVVREVPGLRMCLDCVRRRIGLFKKDKTARPKPAIAAPNVVSLTATEYSFAAPDTIPAGWTTFRLHNHGTDVHYGHMVRLDPGKTVEELVAAYAEAIRTSGPRPKWVTRFGGPGGAAPGDSSSDTQYLEPGSYVWICPVEDDKGTRISRRESSSHS